MLHLSCMVFALKLSSHQNVPSAPQKMKMSIVFSDKKVMQLSPTQPLISKKLSTIISAQENVPAETLKNESLSQSASSTEGVLSGAEVADVKYKYFSEIAHTIHRHKQYPRKAYSLNQEGTVVVRLKLGKEGNILDLMVVEACPFESLNHATLDTISSIERFPPIPKELGLEEMTFRIPIEYKINL